MYSTKAPSLLVLMGFVSQSLGMVSPAYAQSVSYNGYYNGPSVDVNFIKTPPAEYPECREKYINSSGRVYDACNFGVDEARRMAERFAGGSGKTQGYLRGFSWGLYKGVNEGSAQKPDPSVAQALSNDLLGTIQRAAQDGARQGQAVGSQQGSSEALGKFRAAIDSGVAPAPAVLQVQNVADPAFTSTVSDPYRQYVGEPKTIEAMLKDPTIDTSNIKVYNSYDTVYLGDAPQFNVYNYWYADGTYKFAMADWVNKNDAMKIWLQRPIDSKPRYEALGTSLETVAVQNPAPGAPTTAQQQVDLKTIFNSSFVNAYAYYMNYYFSQNFYTNFDEGQRVGEMIGKQVGIRYAQNQAEVQAFTDKFRKDEAAAYFGVFKGAYVNGYNATYQDYASHPKLEIDSFDVVEANPDNAIEPNEKVGVRFVVKNYGLRETSIQASLDGSSPTAPFSIGSLKSQVITTPLLNSLGANVHTSATVNAQLIVSGNDVNSIIVNKRVNVSQQVTPTGLLVRPNVAAGTATVAFTVHNNTNHASSSAVRVVMTDALGRSQEQNLGILNANEDKTASFSLSGLNPIDMIGGSGIALSLQEFYGDIALDSVPGAVLSTNQSTDIPVGFAIAAKDPNRQDQALQFMNELVSRLQDETTHLDRRVYRDRPDGTYFNGVLQAYRGQVQNDSSRALFSKLAVKMWPMRKKFGNFLGIFKSANRKAFEAGVKEINGGNKP